MLFLLSLVVWTAVHSLTAAKRFKALVHRAVGERAYAGLYRLLYNLVSLLTFLPVLYFMATAVSQRVLWRIPAPWVFGALLVQLAGLVGLLYALWQTDVWSFVGVRQAWRYLRGAAEPEAEPRLVTSGPYGWVRHPLYFFSLLILWFMPVMTVATLLFNVIATLYFWIGSVHEEWRLQATFGAAYEAYRRRVPRLLPWPRRGAYADDLTT